MFSLILSAFPSWELQEQMGHHDSVSKLNVFNLEISKHLTISMTILFLTFTVLVGVVQKGINFQNSIWFTIFSPFKMLYHLYKFRKDGLNFFDDFISTNGTMCRLTRGLYIISDPKAIQKILNSNDPHHLNKTELAGTVFSLGGIKDGLVAADPSIWSRHRKLLAPCFSYKSLHTYLDTININAKKLVDNLNNEESNLKGTNLAEVIDMHMIKIISSIVMGTDIVSDEENRRFRRDFQKTKELCMYRVYRPWLVPEFLWRFHPFKKQFDESRAGVHELVYKLIKKYKGNLCDKNDSSFVKGGTDFDLGVKPHRSMIEMMLDAELSDHEILTEVLTFLIAGHESTTTQVTMLMFHLALNPEEQLKCIQEINNLQILKDNEFCMEDLGNLKHLERCILESLRLTPVFPMIMRRIEKNFRIDESMVIEENSDVLIPVWSLHRDPNLHENPLFFQPDRFLSENTKSKGNYDFLPFSTGPRNCIGWKLAIMEIKVVVASILQHFKIETRQKFEDIKFVFDGALKADVDIDLSLIKKKFSE